MKFRSKAVKRGLRVVERVRWGWGFGEGGGGRGGENPKLEDTESSLRRKLERTEEMG